MMEFISIPVTFGIGAYAFYKLIELYVRKKERLMIIEKLNMLDNINTQNINLSNLFGEEKFLKNPYLALRIGSLLMGLGLGLLIGYLIAQLTFGYIAEPNWNIRETISVIYGATTLFFGGMGLITGFIIETNMKRKQK